MSGGWEPRSLVALLLGLSFLVFLLASLAFRLIHPEGPVHDSVVLAWKDMWFLILGGLLSWIGATPQKKDDNDGK